MKPTSLLTLPLLSLVMCTTEPENISRTYKDYLRDKSESILVDFSYAGYHHAERSVPTADHKTFNVCDYGAIANDGISDRAPFEAAIAAAEAHGSGVILFPRGVYELHSDGDPDSSIKIQKGNIVLRGEGFREGGTVINMAKDNALTDPKKLWTSPALIHFEGDSSRTKITDVVAPSPKGSYSVTVASAQGMEVGDWVTLKLQNNDPQLIAEELAPYTVDPKWTDLTREGVKVVDFHMITAIDGKVVRFKEPIMREVDPKWEWRIESTNFIDEVGIEGIAFKGQFAEKFVHHKDGYHDGGYTILRVSSAANSWLRNCSFTDVNVAATIVNSACVSVYNCEVLGHQGHAAIKSEGSSRVFIGNVLDEAGQWHSYGVSQPSMGAVIWRAKWEATTCFESHASQPRNTLFDSCVGGLMTAHAGGAVSNNPNHLRGLVLWNFRQTNEAEQDFLFWNKSSQYWKFVQPVVVGLHHANGTPSTALREGEVLADESHDKPVAPESLYEAQLIDRLGALPEWLEELKRDLYTERQQYN